MARKEKKYHYIYKTTNLKNGKYYVGMHSTDNLEDGYMGSGKRLRRSLNKYGKENFKFEILEFLPDRTSLKEREKELVNEELIKDSLSMNLTIGGEGGFISIEGVKKGGNLGLTRKLKEEKIFKTEWYLNYVKKHSYGLKQSYYRGNREKKQPLDWTGRKHKEESKKKIGEKNSINQKGENNSQFGTCWITNGKENKKIKKEEINSYLCNGWCKGRK